MDNTPLRQMVDRILEGRLDETLRSYADQGLSPGRMALRLAADHQVEVSGQTIRKWVDALPRRTPGRAAQTARTARAAQMARTAQTAQTTSTPPVAPSSRTGGAHVAAAS